MFANALRMTKSVAKLLLRNKAFPVVGIIIPFCATLLINIWSGMSRVEKTDLVYELESMDTMIAYQVDFNRFPVKVYDLRNSDKNREICEALNGAGLFQIFYTDVSKETADDIDKNIKESALEDKIGAIIILADNVDDIKIYSVGEDERFDLLKNTLEIVANNNLKMNSEASLQLVAVNNDNDVDYYKTRDFAYCLAIACIAFIFGGVLILSTVISEKQDHVYDRIMLTTASKASYLLSKLMLTVGFALLQSLVMVICLNLFVKVDIGISGMQFFMILFMMGLIFNLISLCTGLFCNSVAAASFLAFSVWSISALLAGTYFDISSASDLYKKVAMIMPERWAIMAVSRLQQGDNSGYSIMLCATGAFLVIIFVVGVLGLRFSDED